MINVSHGICHSFCLKDRLVLDTKSFTSKCIFLNSIAIHFKNFIIERRGAEWKSHYATTVRIRNHTKLISIWKRKEMKFARLSYVLCGSFSSAFVIIITSKQNEQKHRTTAATINTKIKENEKHPLNFYPGTLTPFTFCSFHPHCGQICIGL